jgi:hypothetical protein
MTLSFTYFSAIASFHLLGLVFDPEVGDGTFLQIDVELPTMQHHIPDDSAPLFNVTLVPYCPSLCQHCRTLYMPFLKKSSVHMDISPHLTIFTSVFERWK